MVNKTLRRQIDDLWQKFWSGGISNPFNVVEQISYLLFIKELDEKEIRNEKEAKFSGETYISNFPNENCRWSYFKQLPSGQLYQVFVNEVFPFIKNLGSKNSTFGRYMKDAKFEFDEKKAGLLHEAVQYLDNIKLGAGDTKGDLYEYLLSKLSTAGVNGQFRTPRHIINMMVKLIDPTIKDKICDPACGTAGFLVSASEFILKKYTSPEVIFEDEDGNIRGDKSANLLSDEQRRLFREEMFYGFDFDSSMLRISAMNMMLHDIEDPNIEYNDTLSFNYNESGKFDIVLANPPFSGSIAESDINPTLKKVVKVKNTEILFLALILRILNLGGRCAVIIPDGVLTDSSKKAGEKLRKLLVDKNQLEAVISLPHTTFKPYASVATSILIFRKGGVTDKVWMYKLENIGNDSFIGNSENEYTEPNDIDDILIQWKMLRDNQYIPLDGKHRLVSKDEIVSNGYDLLTRGYLGSYKFNKKHKLMSLADLCTIEKGNMPASSKSEGEYPLVTTSEEFKLCNNYQFEDEAICIPLVSSTGHGHASIKRLHYVSGKFSAATIMAVLQVKDKSVVLPQYLYYLLESHKDEILVPLMKGAANVSLSLSSIGTLKVPVPELDEQLHFCKALRENDQRIIELKKEIKSRLEMKCNLYEEFKGKYAEDTSLSLNDKVGSI